jgi:tetratricopeptide (TPR) repeat protein
LIERHPDSRNPYLSRGKVHRKKGNLTEALADFDKGIERSPEHADLLLSRAGVLTELGQYEVALADYTKAIELDPNNPDLYQKRGEAYQAMGDSEKAEADFQNAIAKCTDALEVAQLDSSRARLCAARLLFLGAGDAYRQACAKMLERFGKSNNLAVRYHTAHACVLGLNAAPDPTVPLALAQQVVADKEQLRSFHVHVLGMAYFRAGQLEEAERELLRSDEAGSDWSANFKNWLGLALVHHARGELDEAREWRQKAVDWIKSHPEDYYEPTDHQVFADLLLREVEQLLGKADQPDGDTDTEQQE